MAEYDLFELTGLAFDPPEKAVKKIVAAIEKKKTEFNSQLNNEAQQLTRDELNKKITFLQSVSSTIINDAGKLTQDYDELARERTAKEINNLKAAVALMKLSGTHVITNGTVRKQRAKTKLSKDNVEKVFIESGFTITEVDPLSAYPKFPTNADNIYTDLEALRKTADPNPQGKDLTLAVDLYAFTAYLCGEPENAAEYRSKTTSELASLLDHFSKQFSTRNDDLGKLCASLATKGKSYVFNSEDSRKSYEMHLQYKSAALTELFDTMRRLSEADLSNPKFAEQCIKKISEVFGDYEVALAIYNKEAGLKDEPYIPEKAVFHVKCLHCQNISEFSDVNEAQKDNKCSHCGKPLYKQCKKCQKNVLVSLDKCPECGFIFAGAAMFAKFFAAAEQALRRSDFEEARNCLLQAQTADPSENARTSQLEARITAEEKKYEKPVNDLRKLIADKKYQKASEVLAEVIGSFPGLNTADFDAQIKAALTVAKTAFANAKNMSPSKKADACLEILHECVDYKPAIDFLRSTPPEVCKSFSAGLDSSECNANLSWSRSAEQGVSYRVIRKQSKDIPANEVDGEILLDNTTETAHRDHTVLPGRYYSYAVFAVRYGVFSSATGKTILLLADVANAHAEQTGAIVRLTWDVPKNCTGVTISRSQNGPETVLTDSAHGSFEDKDVRYGVAYSYKLCAKYNDLPASQGVNIVITPMPKIESFTIAAKRLKDNIYKVSWNINQGGIDLRILIDEKQVRELKSDAGACNLELPADGFHTISVLAYSGGDWLRNENSLRINTYSPCAIDKEASCFRENAIIGLRESAYNIQLHIKISDVIPSNVVGFYYAVKTEASSDRWPTVKAIGTDSDIHRIGIAAYLKNEEILYTETAHEEASYYVSLFTIYNVDGEEVVSNPKPCRFDRPLTADVFWRVDKSFLGGPKLSIVISGNRPISRVPEFVLCACDNNGHLLSHNDPKATHILTIPAIDLAPSQKIYESSCDIKTDKQLKGLKLFLFEAAAVPNENFIPRWANGFTGKV